MPGDDDRDELKTEELAAIIQEIRDRVRARHPAVPEAGGGAPQSGAPPVQAPGRVSWSPGAVTVADLAPLVHSRDAADAKVAAIGTVNPRPGGVLNALIQLGKRSMARLLDWHVREQVEFNRSVMACVQSTLDALDETNLAISRLGGQLNQLAVEMARLEERALETAGRAVEAAGRAEQAAGQAGREAEEARRESGEAIRRAEEVKDLPSHWAEWRAGWEHKLSVNEVQFLRGIADVQAAFQHRTALMENTFRDLVKSQHDDYRISLEKAILEIQQRLWADLERVRADYEKLIHTELRLIRQRAPSAAPQAPSPPAAHSPGTGEAPVDYGRFEERFRGSEEYVREKQEAYKPLFQGRGPVLDLGCGRGEFLELMRDADVPARGVDMNADCVAICRAKGLDVAQGDLFAHLAGETDCSLGGIFCAQVVEHLPPGRVPELVRLAAAKLRRNGLLVLESPNPECLAIFASHFYLDPTHARPVPPALLAFYLEESGFGNVEIRRFSPAVDSWPSLAELPGKFREDFFGGLDYAVSALKLT